MKYFYDIEPEFCWLMWMYPASLGIIDGGYITGGILEGDQIEVAAFYLESFAYLAALVITNHNAGSNSAKARQLIQI